ncbi:MAG TPA: hypothetical protein VHQ93_20560 [Chitinophagaceae bacterium]|jgi:hypothetical protein|nr:hypothetical protein [Chitinophagaceae bacterium]
MKAGKITLSAFTLAILFLIQACRKETKKTETINEEIATAPNMGAAVGATVTPIQVYGAWHAGNDLCIWGTARTISEFDSKNHWLIDRGNGQPSVNIVILSFVHPLKLLNSTTDATTLNGVPRGMTAEIINYFKDHGIRVMLSIGGITYTDAWDQALSSNATQLGLKAAAVANSLGVGIEIDYEQNRNPKLPELQQFVSAYRSQIPYDPTGNNHAARLTIDLGAGDRWLIDICRKATAEWLTTSNPVLDYANAMVPSRQPSASGAIANWQEHVDGKPQYGPPIPPLAPAKFTGGLYLVGSKPIAECINFNNSLQKSTSGFVQSVLPNGAGATPGMLGYMFWAAECSGTRSVCTTPPNSCQGGVGAGATYFNISIPMQALRPE